MTGNTSTDSEPELPGPSAVSAAWNRRALRTVGAAVFEAAIAPRPGRLPAISLVMGIISKAQAYWNDKPCTVEAVLGGFDSLSGVDLDASEKFLNSVGFLPLQTSGVEETRRVALDNGAGIGRVTTELLIARKLFSSVDASEPCVNYAEKLRKIPQVDNVFNLKLEDLQLPESKYSLIWNQWVLLYLTDTDLVAFLSRCKEALKPDGLLCLKENVIVGRGKAERDEQDNSVTRLCLHFLGIKSPFLIF